MRACVMAAAHFEFTTANSILSISDTKQQRRRFSENQTSINLFQKLLNNFSKLMDSQATQQEMHNLRAINKEIYKEVRNPYLKLYLVLTLERDKDAYKDLFIQLIENSAINLFDYVTLACKFLDKESLITCLKRKLQQSE